MIAIQSMKINLANVNWAQKCAPVIGETAQINYWRIFVKFKGGGDISFRYDNEEDCNADFIKL